MTGIARRWAGIQLMALTAGIIGLGQLMAVAAVSRPELALIPIALLTLAVSALAAREPARLWVLILPVMPLLDYPMFSLMGVSTPLLSLGVVGVVAAMTLSSRSRAGAVTPAGGLVLVAFGVYVILNATLIGEAESLYTVLVAIVPGIVAYFALRSAFSRPGVQAASLWWSVVALGAVLGGLGTAEAVTQGDLLPRTDEGLQVEGGFTRINGPFATSIEYAASLLMVLAVVSAGWTSRLGGARAERNAAAAVGVLCLAAIFFTYFRTAWLLALAVVLVWVARRGVRLAVLGGLAALLVAVLLIGIPPELPSSSLVENRILQQRNVTSRQDTYATALRAFVEHPAVGVGLGRFQEFHVQDAVGVDPLSTPHSAYFGGLAELGLLGFSLLVAALWWVTRGVLLAWRSARAVRAPWAPLAAGVAGASAVYLLFGVDFEVLEVPFPSLLFFALAGAIAGLRARTEASGDPRPARAVEPEPPAVPA